MPASGTTILQSYRADRVAPWLARCLASVADWAERQGHDRLLLDDRFFDPVPAWYADRCGAERLPVTDLARLLWVRRLLDEGRARVIWLDADVLITDLGFVIPATAPHALGREYWVWRGDEGALHGRWSVNNCVMQFTPESALLDFYIDGCQTLVRNASEISRLMVGPTLLTAINAAVPLPLVSSLATLSPTLIDAVARAEGQGIDHHVAAWAAPVHAAHLCRSLVSGSGGTALIDEARVDLAIDRLLAKPGLLGVRA